MNDEQGLHPIESIRGPVGPICKVRRELWRERPEPPHANKRTWEQEALIIGGAAGGGAGIGALVGGKKGAGVGAAAGGVGGLIYTWRQETSPAKVSG